MNNIAVVKFGSELVAAEEGISQEKISEYATGLAQNHLEDGLIVVTSGAVLAGRSRVLESGRDIGKFNDVTLAQLGSASITSAWEQAFGNNDVLAGGLLTTHHEIEDSAEGPSLFRAIDFAKATGVVCIINENDALSDRELMKLAQCEDNDGLASHIATRIGARTLKIFTKMGGIIGKDGELIEEVNMQNHATVSAMLHRRSIKPGNGRGGIGAKLDATWKAARAGIDSSIAKPNKDMTGDNVTRVC